MSFKRVMFISAVALSTGLLFSCNQNHSESSAPIENADSIKKQPVKIDVFTTSPETDTCSCLYAIDSVSFATKQYIFAYDLSLTAYMKVNGTLIKFTQTNFSNAGENTLTHFTGGTYKMILETHDVKESGKEQTIQTGSIRVVDNNGNEEGISFYGMCGCYKKNV